VKQILPLWYLPVLVTALPFVFGPLLARLHVIAPLHGFLFFAAAVVPAVVTLILGMYLTIKGQQPRGAVALITAALPLIAVASGLLRARQFPRINDISTNLDSPPVLTIAAQAPENQGKDLAYPPAFKNIVRESYPGLISLQLDLPPEAAFQLAYSVAQKHAGWRLARVDAPALTLEGEDTGGLFQFTDDFVIRVLPLDSSSQIDMRSRSRVGRGDFGANAQRIEQFFAELTEQRRSPSGTSAQ